MKIAIVHDWLVARGGAENTLGQILKIYPEADLFCLFDFMPPEEREFLAGKKPITSFIQQMPGAALNYRNYLPLMPLAISGLNLDAYDMIISSSHAAAKGAPSRPDQLHLCYCYTPFRYAWDLREQYLKEAGLDSGLKGVAARVMLNGILHWDKRNSKRINYFASISEYIRQRVRGAYERESEVIYPPVAVHNLELTEKKEDYFVTVSRLVPYKKVDLIVQSFTAMPDRKLIVIGAGPDLDKVMFDAGTNVVFLNNLDDTAVAGYLSRARAFVFAAEEDFGIAPLEAQACGTPVIGYGRGGLLETVKGRFADEELSGEKGLTGIFFREQTVESIVQAVNKFEALSFLASDCRENSLRFSEETFRSNFKAFVDSRIKEYRAGNQGKT